MAKIPKISERDEIIGETTISEAKERGWSRRISRVFIFSPEGKMLLQKRSKNMHSYPGIWDQAVGGHVDLGETYKEAAVREMEEELGLKVPITEIETSFKMPNTFNGIYIATIVEGTKINFDPHEVEKVEWVTIAEFEKEILKSPENYTLGFVKIWNTFHDKLIT